MLYENKIIAALEERRDHFTVRESAFAREVATYRAALAALGDRYPSASALRGVLEASTHASGARPMASYDQWATTHAVHSMPLIPFDRTFAHHAAARAWAEDAIAGITTVAVDGSQIMPARDVSLPVALVQAGIFVNPHAAASPYTKDVIVAVLGPADLSPSDDVKDEEENLRIAAEEIVHLRRFELEARTLADWMRTWQPPSEGAPPPIALLDGSLIVSFALTMPPAVRLRYIAAITDLLVTAAQTGVPLIAYIDTSHARDLTTLLRAALPEQALVDTKRINDALIWDGALAWGDCTVPFLSARGDVLTAYGDQRDAIAFTYMQAALDRPPARIEMPRWVAESDLFPHVMDVLRAEIIAGNGYPYAIETADAVAVISVVDRARFYRIFQDFAERNGIGLRFSHKALSKARRRI